MKARLLVILAAVVLSLASGGVSSSFTPLNPAPRPMTPRAVQTVEVFTTVLPARPYVEVGLIEASEDSIYSQADMPQMIQELRAMAARAGCDGIVLTGSSGRVVGSAAYGTGTLKSNTATCVMYR